MDASGGSGSNFPIWLIVDDNGPVDMNDMMDNLEERIANLEMVFTYLKNKKMLKRQENKPKKVVYLDWPLILENQVTTKWCKLKAKLRGCRELKHCKLNMKDHAHPIMTSLEIAHSLHRRRNFLESFGGPVNDPILLLMELPHMFHLEEKFFESCGCLLLVCRDDIASTEFTIYEMMKGSFAWSVRYLVNIVQLLNPLPEGWSIRTGVWRVCLGEREEDAFVAINLSEKVVKYNLISNTNTEIFDIGSNQMDDDDDAVLFIPTFEVDPDIHEFIPSLACV
nr:hypothetical protein [Tanacetum cinerariifolium]